MTTTTGSEIGSHSEARKKKRTLYRGDPGMWSWVLHRISGVAIFFFLFVHVLDTAIVRVNPDTYTEVIETYKNPVVGLLEIGLVGAVLYHALNGVRIILIDFWSQGPRHQKKMMVILGSIFVVLLLASTVRLLMILIDSLGTH